MYHYTPSGVCSRDIAFEISDGKVCSVHFTGGCNGNGKGIAALAEGRTPQELIALLKDVDCGGRGTSCPAQLAKALQKALSELEQ